jgi:hypothetical protein
MKLPGSNSGVIESARGPFLRGAGAKRRHKH